MTALDLSSLETSAANAIATELLKALPDGITETITAEVIGMVGQLLVDVAAAMKNPPVPAAVGATVVS